MLARKYKKLRPDPEFLEGYLWQHGILSPGGVPVPKAVLLRGYLDETLEAGLGLVLSQVGRVDRGRGKQHVVDESEGVEGDALLGHNGEEGVEWVVYESGSDQASGSGDEGRGGALRSLRGDESILKNTARRSNNSRGIAVDVDIVEIVVALEEFLPQRSEREVRIS